MAASLDGKSSLRVFFCGLTFLIAASPLILNSQYFEKYIYYVGLAHFLAFLSILCLKFSGEVLQVAICAYCLGYGGAVGLMVTFLANETLTVFGWYLCVLALSHYAEYHAISIVNPQSLGMSSFLINYSYWYCMGLGGCWLEFVIEHHLFPAMKPHWLSCIGLGLCIGGQIFRKIAILTAHANFNLVIQTQKNEGHVLVTHGVYGWSRHPSYVGYFWWFIGTQIILCNPVCVICYTLGIWRFFNARVLNEEKFLLKFFGEDYVQYKKRVGTLLPFIKGCRAEL